MILALVMAQPQRGVCLKTGEYRDTPSCGNVQYVHRENGDLPSNFGVRYFYTTPFPAISFIPWTHRGSVASWLPGEHLSPSSHPFRWHWIRNLAWKFSTYLDMSWMVAHQRDNWGNWGNPNVWRGFFIGVTGGRIFHEISLGKILLFEELG